MEQYPDKSFEGIGISLPGRVDPVSQRLILAPNLPWSLYDMKKAIERRIPLQVEMDNAANACLLSELWFGRMDGRAQRRVGNDIRGRRRSHPGKRTARYGPFRPRRRVRPRADRSLPDHDAVADGMVAGRCMHPRALPSATMRNSTLKVRADHYRAAQYGGGRQTQKRSRHSTDRLYISARDSSSLPRPCHRR